MGTRRQNGLEAKEFLREQRIPDRRCRECGCTDLSCDGCIERTGFPCSWVEEDLCSACHPVPSEVEIGGQG